MDKIDTLIEEVRDLKRIILDLEILRCNSDLKFYESQRDYFPCEIKPPWVTTSYTNTSDKSITEIIEGWKYE